MPELPEVETVRAGLADYLTGAKVTSVEVLDVRSLKRHQPGVQDFVNVMTGATLKHFSRRGKFLWIPLDREGLAMVGHLGMSGQMLVRQAGTEPDKLTRVILHAVTPEGKKLELRFVDQRIFGSLAIDELEEVEHGEHIPKTVTHIARDPLDPNFDDVAVMKKLRTRKAGIKKVLLDQGVLSGVGNIYADEALWRAKLHYDQSANTLTLP